jgi:hypothetical protein
VTLKGARRRKQVAAERALEALEAWKKVEWDEARS